MNNEQSMAGAAREGPLLLGRAEFDATAMWKNFPLKLTHEGKRLVFEQAGGVARLPSGSLRVARYAPVALPSALPRGRPEFRSSESAYNYPSPDTNTDEWHVNFANAYLFCAYGAPAFAQDEIQVAEHPVLGSLLEALSAERQQGLSPLTVESGRPTPIVIRGAERWCTIDTDPDLAMPYGIYGRRFRTAKADAVRQAVTRLDGSYRTNLIAMEAPMGAGRYTAEQIGFVLETAWSGFAAARLESTVGHRVTIHTGHWGTGAYGGNRVLMAILQMLAARLAGIDRLVYHSIDTDGLDAYAEACRIEARLGLANQVAEAIDEIVNLGFSWGSSDGN